MITNIQHGRTRKALDAARQQSNVVAEAYYIAHLQHGCMSWDQVRDSVFGIATTGQVIDNLTDDRLALLDNAQFNALTAEVWHAIEQAARLFHRNRKIDLRYHLPVWFNRAERLARNAVGRCRLAI